MPDLSREQIPLFQLNLMIWLSLPQRMGKYYPVFHANGFDLYRIAPSIPLSIEVVARAATAVPPIDMVNRPAPELLLRYDGAKHFLAVECKTNSFSPDSKQARQAMGLMTSTGPHISSTFGLEVPEAWRASALFAVTHPKQSAMEPCLEELVERLKGAQIEPCTSTSCGIDWRDDGVYLLFAHPGRMPFAIDGAVKVVDLQAGEDPRPLYIIPLDPSIDARDEYGRRVVEERVRAALASLIGSRLGNESISITWEELLETAIEVWAVWSDRDSKRNLRERVRRYVERVLTEIRESSGVQVRVTQPNFTLEEIRPDTARRVREYLMSAGFRQGQLDFWRSGVQFGLEGM